MKTQSATLGIQMNAPLMPGQRKLDLAATATLGCLALLTLIGVTAIGFSVQRPMTVAPDVGALAQTGIDCPSSMGLYEPKLLQRSIDNRIEALARQKHPSTAELAGAQRLICQMIRQNPRRGLNWLQLLAVTPRAAQEPALWSQLFQRSYDLSRLQVDAARGRISLASRRWTKLNDNEKHIVLADARMLLEAKTDDWTFSTHLGLNAPHGGKSLIKEFRALVTEIVPEQVENFDEFVKLAAARIGQQR